MSIRKHANILKVHEKTVGTAIKQDLSQDLNLFDYTMWGILENKTNAMSHANNGSLKNSIEEEGTNVWRIYFEGIVSNACWCNNWKRWWSYWVMEAILSKFSFLCQSSNFVVHFFKLELILVYNKVVCYYTGIFSNLLPHPVILAFCKHCIFSHAFVNLLFFWLCSTEEMVNTV